MHEGNSKSWSYEEQSNLTVKRCNCYTASEEESKEKATVEIIEE